MQTSVREALAPLFHRLVRRPVSNDPPRRERFGQPSGMIRVELARSAAQAEAARRALR
jgi:hypothetical protein